MCIAAFDTAGNNCVFLRRLVEVESFILQRKYQTARLPGYNSQQCAGNLHASPRR